VLQFPEHLPSEKVDYAGDSLALAHIIGKHGRSVDKVDQLKVKQSPTCQHRCPPDKLFIDDQFILEVVKVGLGYDNSEAQADDEPHDQQKLYPIRVRKIMPLRLIGYFVLDKSRLVIEKEFSILPFFNVGKSICPLSFFRSLSLLFLNIQY
jgi:hypothetical protein